MELKDIEKMAVHAASDMHIDWDRLEMDPSYMKDFESTLKRATKLLPDMEILHTKLSNGESAVFDGQESSLPYDQREHYIELLEEELYAGYQLKDLYDRFILIRSITELDNV